ncbi:unnamed protein product [Schistosoma turkestanicum]|nr:unnamed protein product [Schistosoma turkestanicum]
MRHVRCLSQWRFYPDSEVNIPVNFFFTRAFLGDHFKGFRTCKEVAKTGKNPSNTVSSNCVSEFPQGKKLDQQNESNFIETVPTVVSKHTVFSDSEESDDKQKPAVTLEVKQHPTYHTDVNRSPIGRPLQSKKYFSSVSYTLKHLLHSDSLTSESDSSSSGSKPNLKTRNSIPQAATSRVEKRTVPNDLSYTGSETNSSVDGSEINELCKLLDEMQQLGLPTSFGCLRKQESANPKSSKSEDISFDYDDEEEVDQWLLVFASECKNNLAQRKQRNIVRLCLSNLDIKSMQYSGSLCMSSSGELRSLVDPHICAGSVFSRMCYVLEMVCVFSSDFNDNNSYHVLNAWELNLPRCWNSPTFNLEALLYNCRFFWRYNPPVPKLTCESNHLMCANFDPSMDKYWAQRFRLFSRFDSGIQVDCDSLFSATPEVIAAHQAKRIYRVFTPQTKGSHTILDIFCGTGSNAIQFALRGFRVIAIESDPIRISMAAHNAEIYGVRHLIEFICEDYFTWAWKQVQSNIVSQSSMRNNTRYIAALMSPPWGGPNYLELESFNLSSIKFHNSNTDLWCALYLALVLTNGNVALFLPRNTNMADFLEISVKCIKQIMMDSLDIEFELNLINFKSKALTVYFGALANANNRKTTTNTKVDHSDESDNCN